MPISGHKAQQYLFIVGKLTMVDCISAWECKVSVAKWLLLLPLTQESYLCAWMIM